MNYSRGSWLLLLALNYSPCFAGEKWINSRVLEQAVSSSEIRNLVSKGGLQLDELADPKCLENEFIRQTSMNQAIGDIVESLKVTQEFYEVGSRYEYWYGIELEYSNPLEKGRFPSIAQNFICPSKRK